MPAYIRRPHDDLLAAVLDPVVARGRMVVVRGGSSTGKSRTAYEAVLGRLPGWRLEYPLDAASLARRLDAGIESRTVLWLNELRQYADDEGGPAVIGRLADLLQVGTFLIITTMSHEDWHAYISSAVRSIRGGADPSGVTGRLLSRLPELDEEDWLGISPAKGGVVDVPETFSEQQLSEALQSGSRPLAAAAKAAAAAGDDGRLIQYLAGVPDLIRQYEAPGGNPYGQAVITAAMDAARLGCASPLPTEFLRDAAIGYLTDRHRAKEPGTWEATALAYATEELKGAVRALEQVALPRGGTAGYRIADYLREHGHRTRREQSVPASLWEAFLACPASAASLGRLAEAAGDRGLSRHAAFLWARAVSAGSPNAAARLLILMRSANPEQTSSAALWAARHTCLDDPDDITWLLLELRTAKATEAITVLLARRPEQHVKLDDMNAAAELLGQLSEVGADDAVTALLARRPFDGVDLDDPKRIAALLGRLGYAKPAAAVRVLLARDPFARADLTSARIAASLISKLRGVYPEAVATVAARAAVHAGLEDPRAVAQLLRELRAAGTGSAVTTVLARDPGAHADLAELSAVVPLLAELHSAGAVEAVNALASRVVGHVTTGHDSSLHDGHTVSQLLAGLGAVNADHAAVAVAAYAAEYVSLADPVVVTRLLSQLRTLGDSKALSTLLARDPAGHVSTADTQNLPALLAELRSTGALVERITSSPVDLAEPRETAGRLRILCSAGDSNAVANLLARNPADQADLRDASAIADLMLELNQAGDGAAAALAERAAREIHLEAPHAVAQMLTTMLHCGARTAIAVLVARGPARHTRLDDNKSTFDHDITGELSDLLAALNDVGAVDEVATLAARCYDAGMFSLSRLYFTPGHPNGREPDGTSARPWKWCNPAE
jgi:hypothetical protein